MNVDTQIDIVDSINYDVRREKELCEIRDRLRNWARYCRVGTWTGPPLPACSLGALVIGDRDPDRREQSRPRPDEIDGPIVDRGICSLPGRNRDAITMHWRGCLLIMTRWVMVQDMRERRRILGVSQKTYYRLVERSELMLKNILTRDTKGRKMPLSSYNV